MSGLDMNWVKTQLEQAKVRKIVGDSTVKLIELIDSFEKLTGENKEKVVELFARLALGHAYVEEVKDEQWVLAQPGRIQVADKVRVRSDAFNGALGVSHNGRRGVVVAVRYGDIIIRTTDGKEPVLDGAHYSPQKLEKLIEG